MREKPTLHADAVRNRASILAAAADVGRTTLLRNFPPRMELAAALFEQVMVDMRALVASPFANLAILQRY